MFAELRLTSRHRFRPVASSSGRGDVDGIDEDAHVIGGVDGTIPWPRLKDEARLESGGADDVAGHALDGRGIGQQRQRVQIALKATRSPWSRARGTQVDRPVEAHARRARISTIDGNALPPFLVNRIVGIVLRATAARIARIGPSENRR